LRLYQALKNSVAKARGKLDAAGYQGAASRKGVAKRQAGSGMHALSATGARAEQGIAWNIALTGQ
jgi:hypothetical protein